MPTPSPAALKAYAHELRELATKQCGHAATCDSLLDDVTKLDTAATWQGTYPDAAHKQFHTWLTGLMSTAKALRDEAGAWSTMADQYDERAKTAGQSTP